MPPAEGQTNKVRAMSPLLKVAMWAGGVAAIALIVQGVSMLLGLDFHVFKASSSGRGLIIVLAMAGLVMLMSAEQRPSSDYGLAFSDRWRWTFLLGLLAGIVSFGSLYLLAVASGALSQARVVDFERYVDSVLRAITALPLAVILTIIFPGYFLSMFRERYGRVVSCVAVGVLFAVLSRFEDAGGFLEASSLRLLLGLTLAGVLLAQVRLLTGSVIGPIGLLAGWIAVRKFSTGVRLRTVGDESLAMWLAPGGDPREAPALWAMLVAGVIVAAVLLRRRPEDRVIEPSDAVSESFLRFYPFANTGMFAPLDVWLVQLIRARFRVGPAYIMRTVAILVSATMTFAMTLPERLLAPLLLRKKPLDPVFVVGVHRSGTTHLQNLLSLDPNLVCARTFQVLNPLGFLTTGWLLVPFLKAFSPWKRPMDAVAFGVFSPNEEEFAIANSSGLSPDWAVRLPREIGRYERLTYPERMTAEERERWKRLFSLFVRKLVAFRRSRRPLLKNPYNTARVAILREIYPDARFIHIHRDPYRVYRSNLHMAKQGHTLFQLQAPLPDRNYASEFLTNYRAMEEAYYRDAADAPETRCAEVRFEELETDPRGLIKRLYKQLELDFTDEFAERLDAYLESVSGYRKNVFKPLDPAVREAVDAALAPMFSKWGRDEAAMPETATAGASGVRLAFVVNERSGKGRARLLAESFEHSIADIVDSIEIAPIGPDEEADVDGAIAKCDAVIVFGGDGTMHSIAPIAAADDKPVYHVPLGTENLFAREFRMSRKVDRLRAAIDAWSVIEVDYGRCNGLPFLIMCSVGPDSSVIHRLAAERVGAISRSTYAPHVVRETLRPTIPRLDVEADGRRIVDGRRGIVIVANSRQYALHMDPARMASMTDGLLDVIFLPCTNSMKILTWGVRAFLRSIRDGSNAVYMCAESVQIYSGDAPAPAQVDGEAPGSGESVADHPAAWTPLRIDIVKHALPVLAPPRPGRPR